MRLRRNITWNVVEVVISSLALFILYKIIAMRLGVDAIGVWSLVMAATSLAKFADVGLSGGLGRYVAIAQSQSEDSLKPIIYVETALIANSVLYAALASILYWPAYYGLAWVTEGSYLVEARRLLPYAVVSFALMSVSTVLTAALIGFNRSDQKSKLVLVTTVVQLAIALATVGRIGLLGVVIAQIVQYCLIICIGWLVVLRTTGARWRPPFRLSVAQLKELFGFGMRLQILNVASLLNEPAIKFVMSAVGGMAALGLYEMASRMILQARQLLVSPTQNLIPLFAVEQDAQKLRTLHGRATAIMAVLAVAGLGMLVLLSPVIIKLWIGSTEWIFVYFTAILFTGWVLNIASVPSFLLGIARGRLRWNIAGSALATVVGPTLGLALAYFWEGIGVAVAASVAIGLAGLLFMWMNSRSFGLRAYPSMSTYRDVVESLLSGRILR